MPIYTFTKRAAPVEPNQESNFANVQRDGSKQPLTGYLGNGMQTQDGTATAVTSPVSVATNSVTTLNSPTNSTAITITAKTQSVLISEAVANASLTSWSTNYYELASGGNITLEIANQGPVYLLGGTGASTVSFVYAIV